MTPQVPGKPPTTLEKLANFRTTAKQITIPNAKTPPAPKANLVLNPPSPSRVIKQQQLRDAAAQTRLVKPNNPTVQQPTTGFNNAVVKAPSSLPRKEKNTFLQMKRDFAKAVAQRPHQSFNRAVKISKTKSI